MFSKIIEWYKTGPDRPLAVSDPEEMRRLYESKRWSVFLSITLGYGFYYVCRLSLSVAKKDILGEGLLNAEELGIIGAMGLFTYAFGKFFNGFLADRSNIRKFMSTGLLVSAFVNLLLGFTNLFWLFVILWGLNGWFQAMGAAPSVVSLSQWFSNCERGTRYGIWFVSHSLGEGITWILTTLIVSYLGWRWGFGAPGIICLIVAIAMFYTLADRPQTYGLPQVAAYKNDYSGATSSPEPVSWREQLNIFKNPVVWILGISSALTYISRYAINSWGLLYLQEDKKYADITAGVIMSVGSFVGIAGGAFSGYFSDKFFQCRRNVPTFIYGLLQIVSLLILFLTPARHMWLIIIGVAMFGFAISGTVVFLGGLTAVDLCPKKITGAVMGFIGLFSYLGASSQDWVSGYLIHKHKIVVERKDDDLRFVPQDFKDCHKLAKRIDVGKDPVSRYVRDSLNPEVREQLSAKSMPEGFPEALAREFNRLLDDASLYEEERFARVTFREETRKLLAHEKPGENCVRRNRYLLDDAYPTLVKRSIKYIYNFTPAIYFWVGASILSLLLACTIWNARP